MFQPADARYNSRLYFVLPDLRSSLNTDSGDFKLY